MPKIAAASVAEHRANQRRALLDAAHALLRESGAAPSMQDVAERAGLARSSVYQYFESREDLLHQLVVDIAPKWSQRVTESMAAQSDPVEQVVAYATANLALVADGAHAVAAALQSLVPSEALDGHADDMHASITEPLVDALRAAGASDPAGIAHLVTAMVFASTKLLEQGQPIEPVQTTLVTAVRALVRGLQ